MTPLKFADVEAAYRRDDGSGFCTQCGHECGGVEPDARDRKCPGCGAESVCGAEEILIAFACGDLKGE